jgi:alpha-galactosidase
MRDALNATGRPIFYSICSWGEEDVWLWGNKTGNSWRTTGDIEDNWESVENIFYLNDMHPDSASPGGFNDPDMLEIGNGGLTLDEERSHFALWVFAKSPLLIGCDLVTVKNTSLSILKSELLIKVS